MDARGAANETSVLPAHPLVLDALDRVLAAPQGQLSVGRASLARLAASLVEAPAAAHVRYDAGRRRSRLCLWRASSPDAHATLDLVEAPPPVGPHEWWTISQSRVRVHKWLDQPHLAELPLSTDSEAPSLVVIGRNRSFDDVETRRMMAAYRTLSTLERVADRMLGVPVARMVRAGKGAGTGLPLVSELTNRERQVLEMLADGLLARSIAARLEVSERTVHKHLGSVYRKLDAHDRLLAVRRAESLGLLPGTSTVPAEVPG